MEERGERGRIVLKGRLKNKKLRPQTILLHDFRQ